MSLYKQTKPLLIFLAVFLFTVSYSIPFGFNTFAKNEYTESLEVSFLSYEEEVAVQQAKNNPIILEIAKSYYFPDIDESVTTEELVLLKDSYSKIYELNSIEVIALKDILTQGIENFTQTQKDANYQLNRYFEKIIDDHISESETAFTLDHKSLDTLEEIANKDDTYLRLTSLASGIVGLNNLGALGEVNANAFPWENCEIENGFNNATYYQNFSYWGAQADWVGRSGSDWNEVNNQPCDFVYYDNNYAMNKIDGWSGHTSCIVQRNNGTWSRKLYGNNSNNKVIMGYFTMSTCGPVLNNGYYHYWVRFYS